jgi:hypothetical protein
MQWELAVLDTKEERPFHSLKLLCFRVRRPPLDVRLRSRSRGVGKATPQSGRGQSVNCAAPFHFIFLIERGADSLLYGLDRPFAVSAIVLCGTSAISKCRYIGLTA